MTAAGLAVHLRSELPGPETPDRLSCRRGHPGDSPLKILLQVAALLFAASAATGGEFTVLSYNTHGLSAWVAGDDPETRFPIIGEKSNAYDLALLQEDFAHHPALLQEAEQPIVARGNPSRFGRWCPVCFGSGLTILSRLEKRSLVEVVSRAYRKCAGWIGRANDCFATKGFQRMRIRLEGGAQLDLVNTHLDAGRSREDREARRGQLDLLRTSIEAELGGGALILGGDLNLDAADPEDVSLLDAFTSALRLESSGARGPKARRRLHLLSERRRAARGGGGGRGRELLPPGP
jgi:endonuclease/exonuclease/phosphatase family metal-dependent hydrolase